MKEARTVEPGRIELRETASPAPPGPGEALLEVAAVGLCGSDLELFRGTDPYSHFPTRQGHEFSARVLELGSAAAKGVTVGDLVAVEPLLADGTCIACRRGHPNCCVNLRVTGGQIDGALAERITMPVANLFRANDLTPAEAAFVEPVSIGLQMVSRSRLQLREQAVVFGAGPIGQSVLLAARDRGARVFVVDRLDSRLTLAAELGAEMTISGSDASIAGSIAAWTGQDGPVAVFEATGSPGVLRTALDVVAHGGTVVIAGTPTQEVSIPPFLIVYKELNVLGSRNNNGVFGQALEIVRKNRPIVRRLITHTFPLERTQEGMEFAIANPDKAEKVMIAVSDDARQTAA
jgi:threonine dehydrogenase-like Zn-dependent dehydrogenase